MNMIVYDGASALSELFENFDIGEFQELTKLKAYKKAYLIIDEDAFKLHWELIDQIEHSFVAVFTKIYSGGEASKNIETALEFIEDMTSKQIDRTDVLIAIGGGSVLDLSGFVASIYKRGIDWYNFPTTLLSAVDAGIGGKTAVNTAYGKNLIGSFHMPVKTIIIDAFLKSLPEIEVYSGFGEILKMAMLKSAKLYEELLLSEHISDISSYWETVALMGKMKLEIVKEDFRDLSGLRAILNLGHTYGHAIEKLSDGELKHGICVLYGIDFALFVSMEKFGFPKGEFKRYQNWLKSQKFYKDLAFKKSDIFDYMRRDKKAKGGQIAFVCLKDIAEPEICEISMYKLQKLLYQYEI